MDLKTLITEKVEIRNTNGLSSLLSQTVSTKRMLNSMDLDTPVSEIRIQHFLRGLRSLVSELKTKEAMSTIVSVIQTLFQAFDYELSENECFVLYQLKDLGKFRLKDDKLYSQLQTEWSTYKDYIVEKNELKQMLKDFKNIKLLEYRRGAVQLNQVVILRS